MKRYFYFSLFFLFSFLLPLCPNLFAAKPIIDINLIHHPPTIEHSEELNCCPSNEDWCGLDGEETENTAKNTAINFINNNIPSLNSTLVNLIGSTDIDVLYQEDNLTLENETWVIESENYKKYELNYKYTRNSVSRYEDEDAIYIVHLTEEYDFHFEFGLKRGELCQEDEDSDGVNNDTEDSAPNNGDGNGDGAMDSNQSHVTSLPTPDNARYITLVEESENALHDVKTQRPGTQNIPVDPNYTYPFGVISFKINTTGTTKVKIYFHGILDLTGYIYRKYGPTPDNPQPHWYTFPNVRFGQENIGGNIVAYAELTLGDQQIGDSDSTVGVILDPGGPALPKTAVKAVPTLNEWGIILTVLFISLTGALTLRKKISC